MPDRDLATSRVVIKLGSSTIRAVPLQQIAAQVGVLRRRGVDVALVSSGAVASGMDAVGHAERPTDIPLIQALAAIGQVDLMAQWRSALAEQSCRAAQVLLTHESLSDRTHFLNVRHTVEALFALGAIPVINENDTVATEELRFGDNDRLAAAFATVADADLVILLSDIDALYDADPRVDAAARPIHEVPLIDDRVREMAGTAGSDVGTGGMSSKVDAAQIAIGAGIPLVIASGSEPDVISRIVAGERIGTCFAPPVDAERVGRRRHWIGFLSKLCGAIVVDAGAVEALTNRGSSLLPAGVVAVRGRFCRGDGVAIEAADGGLVARGLVGYDHETLNRIKGLRSPDIAALLKQAQIDPVVHRNDLVLTAALGDDA